MARADYVEAFVVPRTVAKARAVGRSAGLGEYPKLEFEEFFGSDVEVRKVGKHGPSRTELWRAYRDGWRAGRDARRRALGVTA